MSSDARRAAGQGRSTRMSPLNWIRRKRPYLPALGLWLAAVVVDPQVRAEAPAPTDAEAAKVHGTISVDFDKVTISELLKLVSAVEKVDGVIHIVSSHPREGEEAIVVGGARGAVTLASPASPSSPRMVIGAARPAGFSPIHQAVAASAIESPEFPRIASLARLLGMGRRPEPAGPSRIVPTATAAQPPARGVIPLETEPARSSPTDATASPTALKAGTRIGSLAAGEPVIVGRVHSPWPASEDVPNSDVRPSRRDPEVSRTSLDDQTSASSPDPQRCVAKSGDTFESLARKHYGDARYASALWWANRDRVSWPNAQIAGKAIKIPGLGQLEPRLVMAQSPPRTAGLPALESIGPRRDPETVRASFTQPSAEQNPTATDAGGFAVHVVRPDDTLRIIAREKCGDEQKALEIIALNRDALSREGRPRVGQCLILPAPATSTPTK